MVKLYMINAKLYILDKDKKIIHKRTCKHIDYLLEKSKKIVTAHYYIPADYKECPDCKPKVSNNLKF